MDKLETKELILIKQCLAQQPLELVLETYNKIVSELRERSNNGESKDTK